jgi:hypothetical protein
MQCNFSSLALSWLGALTLLWMVVAWHGESDQQQLAGDAGVSHRDTSSIIPLSH